MVSEEEQDKDRKKGYRENSSVVRHALRAKHRLACS